MQKYAKLINETAIEFAPKNKGSIINYDLNIEAMTQDGYKPFIPAEKEIGKAYNITYKETADAIEEIAEEIIPDPAEVLQQVKEDKIVQNDASREAALNSGVTYKGILFDSDTEQKANIIGSVLTMSETDTIMWFGMNNDAMECTREDLENIGVLIAQLHSFCWTRNAEIKHKIALAETIEEVNAIVIDYAETPSPSEGEGWEGGI